MATRKAITLVSGLFQEVNTPTDKLDFAGNTTADLGENTNLYFTNSDGKIIIADLSEGKVLNIEKISGDLVSEPFIFNNNLYVVRNSSIVQYN